MGSVALQPPIVWSSPTTNDGCDLLIEENLGKQLVPMPAIRLRGPRGTCIRKGRGYVRRMSSLAAAEPHLSRSTGWSHRVGSLLHETHNA
jgi:hypothetical protein